MKREKKSTPIFIKEGEARDDVITYKLNQTLTYYSCFFLFAATAMASVCTVLSFPMMFSSSFRCYIAIRVIPSVCLNFYDSTLVMVHC